MILEQLPSAVRERHQHRAPVFVAVERRYGSNQFGRLQPFEVAVPQVSRASAIVEEFVDGNHAKGADRRESPDLGAPQLEGIAVEEDPLAFPATRQLQTVAKDVTRIRRVAVPNVVRTLTRVPQGFIAGVGIAGIGILPHTCYRRVETR